MKTLITSACLGAAVLCPASAQILFAEDFETPEAGGNQAISTVGWVNDIANAQDDRIFEISAESHAVWSWHGSAATEAFYTTVEHDAGFTSFEPGGVDGLTFGVDNQSQFNGTDTVGYFAVQLDGSDWFVSATPVGAPTEEWQTHEMAFDPTAANWNTLTVSGTGTTNAGATIGAPAGSDLAGTVTGGGFVVTRTGSATQNFDNLTLFGGASAGAPALGISRNGADLDFEWNSRQGKLYDLLTSPDLGTPTTEWPIHSVGADPYEAIPGTGGSIALTGVPSPDPRRFFALREYDAPPVFSKDFEEDDGGFTTSGTPNDWAWGTPNSNNGFGLVLTTGNEGSTNCWSTNPGDGGEPSGVIDVNADSILRSPDIDLTGITGAELTFAAAYDTAPGDLFEVRVRDATSDEVLTTFEPVDPPADSDWTGLGPFDLAPADNKNIYLEFRFQGTDNTYLGLYIDDVVISR